MQPPTGAPATAATLRLEVDATQENGARLRSAAPATTAGATKAGVGTKGPSGPGTGVS